jgi:magnesium-transporting ATPase (P-type)
VRHPTVENLIRVYVKGAPEIVIDLCESYFDQDGNLKDLTNKQKDNILSNIVTGTFAKKAFRTLLIAYTDLTVSQYE